MIRKETVCSHRANSGEASAKSSLSRKIRTNKNPAARRPPLVDCAVAFAVKDSSRCRWLLLRSARLSRASRKPWCGLFLYPGLPGLWLSQPDRLRAGKDYRGFLLRSWARTKCPNQCQFLILPKRTSYLTPDQLARTVVLSLEIQMRHLGQGWPWQA